MRLLPDLGCFAIVLHLVEQGTSQTVCSNHNCVFSTLQLIHHKSVRASAAPYHLHTHFLLLTC